MNPFTLEPYQDDDEEDGNYSEMNFPRNENMGSLELDSNRKLFRKSAHFSIYEGEQLEKNEYDGRLPRFKTIALKPKSNYFL